MLGELSAIERASTATGDGSKRSSQNRETEGVALSRRLAILQAECTGRFIAAQDVTGPRPVERHARGDHEAFLGQLDRRLQELAQLTGAVGVEQGLPAGQRTGHGHGMR